MTSAEILPPREAVTRHSWRALPWCFSAVALTFVVAVVLEGSLRDPGWRWAVIVVGFSAAAGATRSRLPLPFVLISCLAAVRLGTAGLPENGGPPGGPWELAVNVALALAMCLMALMTFQYRSGRLGTRDAVDGLAVLLGSGVVAWTVVANPLIEDDRASTVTALAVAAYLPLTSLLLVLTIDVAFSGLSRNRTVMFATAAASTHLVATWIWALEVTGILGPVARDLGVAGNAAALCFLGAAMTHRDAPRSLRPIDPTQGDSDTMVRVVIMGVSVIVPLALVAAVAPTSPADIVVRAIGITALVVAIIVRLQIATRQSRESRETLLQQVTRDDLTKLPNRSRFVDVVADVLESTWHSPQRATVIQLNLDRFKNINDTFGHYAANQVLIVVGERLASIAESIDATVARVGGDDFALVHAGLTSPDEAVAFAEALRAAVTTPVMLGDANVFVTASIGAALAPRNRTTAAEDLVRHADIAAHQAKQNGRNRVELFDESMQARLTRRMDVENALHGAIGRREMRLFHQPIVDITTGRISGFEALLRWERQDGTFVSPADFIPVAEETGVIFELGAWALRDALTSLRCWIDDGLVPPSATMSVNVSPRQVADPGFPAVVRATIAETGVPPHLVWLEITESMMLDEPELAARALDEIRSTGVRIAMDDFGTGYSSLSVLQQFPIQRIKIDRAFVNGLGEHGDDRSLVRTIIAMARSMALDLVAEGVETIDQLEGLRQLGCDKAQGFLISRPVPADAMRSTMVALEEMADLSLFTSPEPADAGTDALDDAANDESTTEQSPTRPRAPQFAVAGHLSPMSSRPLGGPHV